MMQGLTEQRLLDVTSDIDSALSGLPRDEQLDFILALCDHLDAINEAIAAESRQQIQKDPTSRP